MKRWLTALVPQTGTRNTLILLTGSGGGQLVALLAYPVLTRLYSPSAFGVQALFMTLGLLLSAVASGRYEQGLLLPRENRQASRLLLLLLLLSAGFLLVLQLVLSLWKNKLGHFFGADELAQWLPWLPLYCWMLVLSNAFNMFANRHSGFRSMASYQFIQSGASAGFRIGLAGAGAGGLITGSILGQLAGLLSFTHPVVKNFKPDASSSLAELPKLAREYSKFPFFKMPGVFINFLSGNLPIFVLSAVFTPAVSGLYALAYTAIFRPLNLFINSVSQVFAQDFISRHHRNEALGSALQNYLRRLFLLGIAPFLLALLFAPWLFAVIFGKEWAAAGEYLRWMLPWLFLVYFSSGINFIPDMFGQQQKAMWIDVVLLALRIAALAAGAALGDARLAIALFSLTGTLIPVYLLLWYWKMVREHDLLLR